MSVTNIIVDHTGKVSIGLDNADDVLNMQMKQQVDPKIRTFMAGINTPATQSQTALSDGSTLQMTTIAHKSEIKGIDTQASVEFAKLGANGKPAALNHDDIVAIGTKLSGLGMKAEAPHLQVTIEQAVQNAAQTRSTVIANSSGVAKGR